MTSRSSLLIVIVVVVALTLAACAPSTTPAPSRPEPQVTVGGGGEQPAGGGQPTIIPTLPPVTAPAMMFPTRPPAEEATEAPTPEGEPVVFEALEGSAESLSEAWSSAYALEPGVPFTVITGEAEVAALIATYLAETDLAETFSDVAVTLEEGQITFNFTLMLRSGEQEIPTPTSVVFAPSIDAEGNLVAEVVSVEAEGLPSIPEEVLNVASTALVAAISGARERAAAGVEATFTEVVVEDGTLSISGVVTPA